MANSEDRKKDESARRVSVKLWIGGHDATDYAAAYLKELTYTDNADGEADDLQFTLHDMDGRWCNEWKPAKGTEVKCTIVCRDWKKPGEDLKLPCGTFKIDEIEYSGPPMLIRFKALTSAMTTGLRDSRKNRAWKGTSVKAVAGQIAKENGLKLQYEGDEVKFERKDQRGDSDLGFLARQCKENGLHLKVHDGKLVIRDARKAEMQKPKMSIPMLGSMYSPKRWSFKSSSADTGYTKARARYTDPKKGKTHLAEVKAERSKDSKTKTGTAGTAQAKVEKGKNS